MSELTTITITVNGTTYQRTIEGKENDADPTNDYHRHTGRRLKAAGDEDYNHIALARHVSYENAGTVEFLVSEDGTVFSQFKGSNLMQGYDGILHGGIIAATFDELLGSTNLVHMVGGMTGTLTIRYRRPTPVLKEIELEGWLDRVDGRSMLDNTTVLIGSAMADASKHRRVDYPLMIGTLGVVGTVVAIPFVRVGEPPPGNPAGTEGG